MGFLLTCQAYKTSLQQEVSVRLDMALIKSMLGHFEVALKFAIWCGIAGRIGKSISAKIRIYTNASRFQR